MQRIETSEKTPEERLKRIIGNADAIIAADPGYPFDGTSFYRSLRPEHKTIYGDVFGRLMVAERAKVSASHFGLSSPLKQYQQLCIQFGRTRTISNAGSQQTIKIGYGSKHDKALRQPIINEIKSLFTPEQIKDIGNVGVNRMIDDMINYSTSEFTSRNQGDLILKVFTTNLQNYFAMQNIRKLIDQTAEKDTIDLVVDAFKEIVKADNWDFDDAMGHLSDLEIAHYANMIIRKFIDILDDVDKYIQEKSESKTDNNKCHESYEIENDTKRLSECRMRRQASAPGRMTEHTFLLFNNTSSPELSKPVPVAYSSDLATAGIHSSI